MVPFWNWEEKRGSVDQKRRMSGMEKRTMERRSRPRPKAQPDLWDMPGAEAGGTEVRWSGRDVWRARGGKKRGDGRAVRDDEGDGIKQR